MTPPAPDGLPDGWEFVVPDHAQVFKIVSDAEASFIAGVEAHIAKYGSFGDPGPTPWPYNSNSVVEIKPGDFKVTGTTIITESDESAEARRDYALRAAARWN